jgi:prepilin-type N-terminal cleavage/methylation domain-containing protein
MYKPSTINQKQGFSLIELSIVLIIIAVVIGLISFSIQARIEAARLYTTKERMELIANAIDAYYAQYGVLPCGAPSVERDNENYGFSRNVDYDINQIDLCDNGNFGRDVPFKVLGLDAATIADGWGNRFAYFWTGNYARINYVDDDNIPDGTTNFNQLRNFEGGNVQDMAYVLLSLGANGYNAIDDKTNTRNAAGAMTYPEASNAEAAAETGSPEPVTRMYYNAGVGFDDIVVYRLKQNLPQYVNADRPEQIPTTTYTYQAEFLNPQVSNCQAISNQGYFYCGPSGGVYDPNTSVLYDIISIDCNQLTVTIDALITTLPTKCVDGPSNSVGFGFISLIE